MTASGAGCFLMISETRQKIPESRIVAFDDSFKSIKYVRIMVQFLRLY